MKKFLTALMLALAASAFAGQVEVKVSGMVCSMCAQGIQKKFKDHPAVHHLEVNLDEKLVSIYTQDGKELSDKAINKLIKEAGYNVAGIERK